MIRTLRSHPLPTPARRMTVALVTSVALLVTPAAFADHAPQYPPQRNCVQFANTPLGGGPFIDLIGTSIVAGGPCRFTSTGGGGYRAAGDEWRVIVESPVGGRRVYASVLGHPRCADTVIGPTDRVWIESSSTIAAGRDIGCVSW